MMVDRCSDDSLPQIFWMTALQKDLYRKYHDVTLQDNTYRVNKYSYPLCFIVAVDGDNHSRVVAQALIVDEKTNAFEFIFQHLLQAADGLHPRVMLPGSASGDSSDFPKRSTL